MKAMLIECLGPSGVGKTTMLRNIYEKRKGNLVFPEDLVTHKVASHLIRTLIEDNEPIRGCGYTDHCFRVLAKSDMGNFQKYLGIDMIFKSYKDYMMCRLLLDGRHHTHIIHDELCLHRANSILHFSRNWREDTEQYFSLVPLPDAAIFILSSVDEIMRHVNTNNGKRKNCYALFDTEKKMREAIDRLLEINLLGSHILSKRGIPVKVIDISTCALKEASERLDEAIEEIIS